MHKFFGDVSVYIFCGFWGNEIVSLIEFWSNLANQPDLLFVKVTFLMMIKQQAYGLWRFGQW